MSDAQRHYIALYCETFVAAMDSDEKEVPLDLDEVADQAAGGELPAFFSERRQQSLVRCSVCEAESDILGQFAYCTWCGRRNDLDVLSTKFERLRAELNNGGRTPGDAVRDAVSAFDSFASHIIGALGEVVAMTPARRSELAALLFHDLDRFPEVINRIFGIAVVGDLEADERAFLRRQFFRRHVYEHLGGIADDRYVERSGDEVPLGSLLRDTQESAHRTMSLLRQLAEKVHAGFHEIIPTSELVDGSES